MHLIKENRFTDRFWGRIPLQTGAALYHFQKETSIQHLIFQLKYNGKSHIGYKLGLYFGKQLTSNSTFYKDIDLIIPVPLHPIKERKRGYNQSAHFAAGLSESMQKPWLKNGLKRITHGESQTRKTREERYENVLKAFKVYQTKKLTGKHILLVDDVLTTGATLEGCAMKILALPNTRVSMATIAIAGTE
jgi:ComF family protein